ncbi:MAG: hypothetical protein KI792_12410 [Alphaproteobacteria bacterium]|nr:hypothetical protein [Alphaproteobacteria bacterium SS10]
MSLRSLALALSILCAAFIVSPSAGLAQDTASEQQLQQLQDMINNPEFQSQLRDVEQLLKEQGLPVPPELQSGFLDGMAAYNQCLSNGLGPNWMSSMMQTMRPYMEHVQGLCQQGRQQAAAAFVNDERNAERLFSASELRVLEQCEAQFPDQAMLNTGASEPVTAAEICSDF